MLAPVRLDDQALMYCCLAPAFYEEVVSESAPPQE